MSDQAINFKKLNKGKIDFLRMSFEELNSKLPKHVGIVNFKISKTSFLILNILNDDSSAVKFFWQDIHDLPSLDIWYDICMEEGLYIDVGAHTGLYTLTAFKANINNMLLCYEPFYLNMARLVTNLRLNNILKNFEINMKAVSNIDSERKFKIRSLEVDKSYLSKGGKISTKGETINTIKLDNIGISNYKKPLKGIKIDTEGEDFNVLLGSENTIKYFRPKIIIEVRDEIKKEVQDFFNKYNYYLYDVLDTKNKINIKNLNIEGISNILCIPQ